MELGRLLKGKTVFIDTAPLIFFIEKNPKYSAIVKPVVALIDSGQAKGVTSTITLLEVLVLPLREGNKKLADAYRSILLSSKNLETCEYLMRYQKRLQHYEQNTVSKPLTQFSWQRRLCEGRTTS